VAITNLKGKFRVLMLALAFAAVFACISNAGMGGGMDRQTAPGATRVVIGDGWNMRIVPVVSWSEAGKATSSSGGGAVSVDRDLYPFHYDDVNQFGDDEAYNSTTGHTNNGVRFPIHREDP
jgi:hypothetical protein